VLIWHKNRSPKFLRFSLRILQQSDVLHAALASS